MRGYNRTFAVLYFPACLDPLFFGCWPVEGDRIAVWKAGVDVEG